MAAKRNSTVQIPVHVATGNVPHYCETQDVCKGRIALEVEELNRGFKPVPEGQWKPFHMASEETWRARIEQVIRDYDFEWRDPWEFVDTFKITGYGRGRSSAVLEMESTTTGMQCVMMMKDMTHMIRTATITKGIVSGRWIFGKRGMNYGLQYLGEQ